LTVLISNAAANEAKSRSVKIEEVKVKSTYTYFGLEISDFVVNKPSVIEVQIINDESATAKKLALNSEINYMRREGSGGKIGLTGFEISRLVFKRQALPEIKGNSTKVIKVRTRPIAFERPPIDKLATLILEVHDLEEDKNIHKFMHTVTIATQSEVEEHKRGLLNLVISIIILIVAGLTLCFAIRQYKLSKRKELNNSQGQPILKDTDQIKEETAQTNKE
jgi:hypothetical protein